jgi:hypothetical protein
MLFGIYNQHTGVAGTNAFQLTGCYCMLVKHMAQQRLVTNIYLLSLFVVSFRAPWWSTGDH